LCHPNALAEIRAPFFRICPERIPVSRVNYLHWVGKGETPMIKKLSTIQSQDVMGGFYLGIAITGVEALVAMGLVIAFM
jgi:hypothetical protein